MATGSGPGHRIRPEWFFGLLLIGLGVLFFLSNFGYLPPVSGGVVVGGAFAALGLFFLAGLVLSPRSWWLVIPGFTLIGLGALIVLGDTNPDLAGTFGAPLFLSCIGLAFLAIYPFQHGQWWPLIPAGTMLTIAAVTALGTRHVNGDLIAAALFLGLAATFVLVFLAGETAAVTKAGAFVPRARWALIPAAALAGFGGISFIGWSRFFGVFWPVVLILLGLSVLLGRRR